jgi:hypothetical protein
MVLSAAPIFIILPVMALLRRGEKAPERLGIAAAILLGVVVYFITNPYVGINLLNSQSPGGQALRSNFANSKAMYQVSPRGIRDGIVLIALAASPLLALLGLAGAILIVLIHRRRNREAASSREREAPAEPLLAPSPATGERVGMRVISGRKAPSAPKPSTIAWLILAPAIAVTLQFILLASGKPAEYARFAGFPAIALLFVAAWGASLISTGNNLFRQLLPALLVVSALPYGLAYLRAFVRDARAETSRTQSADELPPTGRILLYHEPAPYNTPPVNLFRRDLVLVPAETKPQSGSGDILIYPVDVPIASTPDGPRRLPFKEAPGSLDQFTTPITWANKTFAVEGLGAIREEGFQFP